MLNPAPRALTRHPTVLFAGVFMGIALLTRLGLLAYTGTGAVNVSLWPGLFLHGLMFDLAVLAWLLAPLLWISALSRQRATLQPWRKSVRLLFFWLATAFLVFGALSEWTFWEEFYTRFNFIAVDYLIYTQEVIGNIRESYPVGALLTGVGVLAALLVWSLRKPLLQPAPAPARLTTRLLLAGLGILLPWAAWELTDSDQMAFSSNAYANELAGNGLYTFAAAARRNELDYDRFYRGIPDAQARQLLAGLGSPRALPAATAVSPLPPQFSRRPKNVVLISVESLSASFLGVMGNPEGLTPRLDALAREGLLLTRLYATGTRTVRGLEALSLGTPPVPGQSIVRRPGNDHLATLGEMLTREGYDARFIYGGYGYFDNMNAYFAGNNYAISDRTDFAKDSVQFENVWGVADEFLYDNALRQFNATHQAGKPFFAHIMTTSNHRPYTYPDGRIDIPSPGGRSGAVKYTDYAIGHFIDLARKQPWFADTLFVIVADHCAKAAGNTELSVPGYHIPLIFYGPALVKPGRVDQLLSQIDIPPTLLDVMGKPGQAQFYGTSIFRQTGEPRAFIANYQALGYLKNNQLIVLNPKKRVDAYRLDDEGNATPTTPAPQLVDEAVAWYQTASRDFKRGELKLK